MNAARVASILRVRRLQERQARGHLAAGHHVHAVAARNEHETREHVRACADRHSTQPAALPALLADREVIVSGLLAASGRRADTTRAAVEVATLTDAWTVTARRVDALERMDERIREIDRIELDRVERAEVDDLVSARHPREATR
jgi:predicted NBD/HSP70 family sugar kinase